MCLIWNLIKAFTDTQDDNKKDTHEDDILDFEWFDENE